MLDERTKKILYAVIHSYINNPEPVGSRYVTKKYDFGVSSATIRNIMADLEELGFLTQPHTSAGRVPTDRGYRYFVDSILKEGYGHLDEDLATTFLSRLQNIRDDIDAYFAEVSALLSRMSNYMGIAQAPKPDVSTFKRIELIRYRGESIAAVLFTNEGLIKHRVIQVDPLFTQKDLNRLSDYLNKEYAGLSIDEVKSLLFKRLRFDKVVLDRLLDKAFKIYEQILSFSEGEIYMEGLLDVLTLPDFADISKIKQIYKAIKDKHIMLKIIDSISKTDGVQVIIGRENEFEELSRCSIVASTYGHSGKKMGVIALIGPTRMDYSKAISMVDFVSNCLTKTFSE
ncbi:MAG: heat-inducible transcriptional repressor HrcA [Thermodesulfovibrionales bacterium]|nr:heat-inducible transcriptional repressor HrcA [Thermodesulfovibrionales bacterium]